MSRLPAISDADASSPVTKIFAGARDCLGWVSNCTRTVAHSPWVAEWWVPFVAAVEKEGGGTLSGRYKQLAEGCRICGRAAHLVPSRDVGVHSEPLRHIMKSLSPIDPNLC